MTRPHFTWIFRTNGKCTCGVRINGKWFALNFPQPMDGGDRLGIDVNDAERFLIQLAAEMDAKAGVR